MNTSTIPTDRPIGKYGRMRKKYLREELTSYYLDLLIQGTLREHLADIEERAQKALKTMEDSINAKNPPPDKAADQMGWVGHMNMSRLMADEWVVREIVLAPLDSMQCDYEYFDDSIDNDHLLKLCEILESYDEAGILEH